MWKEGRKREERMELAVYGPSLESIKSGSAQIIPPK
jgi:hypothetical protein